MLYASVWRRVFAIAQVLGEPEPRDHPRWPWTIEIETLLVVPVLDAAPPVEAIGVAARSMSQQSHISIERAHYEGARRGDRVDRCVANVNGGWVGGVRTGRATTT